jgi:hypothetical protein
MNLQTVANLLSDINDGLILNKTIYREAVEAHYAVLHDVPDEYCARIKLQLIRTWKFASLPKPAHLLEIYEGMTNSTKSYDADYKAEHAREKALYEERKSKHRIDVVDFIKRIINDDLTKQQQPAYDLMLKHMRFHGEGRTPKEELRNLDTPYSMSFTGLYMDWLEGKLPEIKGAGFGDVGFISTGPKPYNEAEYKKDKARQRSLELEKQREWC